MALPRINHLLHDAYDKRRDSIVDEMHLAPNIMTTNRTSPAAPGRRNMQFEAPIAINMNHDMANQPHYAAQNLYVPNGNGRIKSEAGSDRGVSPHTSEHSSRYSSQTPQNPITYQQIAAQLSGGMRYPSPSQMQQQGNMPLMQHSYHPTGTPDQSYPHQQQAQMGAVQQQPLPHDPNQQMDNGRASTGSSGLPKAFACSTCSKGFARRSDLARHERIHSGIRPHVCDHPGCGKQFIQRSALTVHSRVHTGEKPHMCERCGKPFSDSSSLARHRRIHSGKRPYKCPYADCQKTFTRRTTLTRHQNHHTGTIEESEAATAAALASRVSMAGQRSRGSDEEYSENGKSPMPQQPDRPSSVSPASAMNGMPQLNRQTSDYYMNAMNGGMAAVPPHMRGELQPASRPQSPAQFHVPSSQAQRPTLTSNPSAGYNPPQILEPPTANGQQGGSGTNSPHNMNAQMGWQSPHAALQQQQQHQQHQGDYAYDVQGQAFAGGVNVNNMPAYYAQQRPHSTGPIDYGLRNPAELWQHQA